MSDLCIPDTVRWNNRALLSLRLGKREHLYKAAAERPRQRSRRVWWWWCKRKDERHTRTNEQLTYRLVDTDQCQTGRDRTSCTSVSNNLRPAAGGGWKGKRSIIILPTRTLLSPSLYTSRAIYAVNELTNDRTRVAPVPWVVPSPKPKLPAPTTAHVFRTIGGGQKIQIIYTSAGMSRATNRDHIEIIFSDDEPVGLQLVDEPAPGNSTNENLAPSTSAIPADVEEAKLLNRAESIANRLAVRAYRDIPPAPTDDSADPVWTCDTTTDKYRRNRLVETQRLQRINRLLDLQQSSNR